MSRILFIENRYSTFFWSAMADLLIEDGHEVFFVVENHSFKPVGGNVYVIPYPTKTDLAASSGSQIFVQIEKSDRAINYFGLKNSSHYSYYFKKIEQYIVDIKPDIVFGESTAFHELLTIEICKQLNIMYLQPGSCRYPAGRFSFYKYDTLETYSGSNQKMDNDRALSMINKIVNRAIVPDYMIKPSDSVGIKIKRMLDLLKHTKAYFEGEHYCTPNPFLKIALERKRKRNIERWDKMTEHKQQILGCQSFKILYPLQMQPEANLDVWGRKYNDQLRLIKDIITTTDNEVMIVVKPNPKSKYELSSELIDYVNGCNRIIPIKHGVPMAEVFSEVDMVVTVTGTIAIESILSNKPVVTLIKTMNNVSKNCIFISSLSELQSVVDVIRKSEFPIIDNTEKIAFINMLNKTSFAGLPYGNSDITNTADCKVAFDSILKADGK
ncbi:MAG: hypothetical protein RR137_06385 [Odoribacter sp.]